ncbi:MAG: winged helix-turn-helix domain-containing protein [Candidatus Thermoplasmatota archaeon]
MDFEIKVSDHKPIVSNNLEEILENFLLDIGYLSGRKSEDELYESVPFRLWTECFLEKTEEFMTVDELAMKLDTTKPTIYRHLNKLKGLQLVEEKEMTIEDDGEVIKKGYRLRQGDLLKAWHTTELNIESNLRKYKETVERINMLSSGENIITDHTCPNCGEKIKKIKEMDMRKGD